MTDEERLIAERMADVLNRCRERLAVPLSTGPGPLELVALIDEALAGWHAFLEREA